MEKKYDMLNQDENAFQIEREDKSYEKNPQEVPDKVVEQATEDINLDEETRERG